MTNYQRFMVMTGGLDAPTQYLKMAWLFCVSAALERRVIFGDNQRPLFANQYMMFIGPAGLGKGLALSEIARLLNRFPLYAPEERKKPAHERKPVIDPETHLPRKQFHSLPDATTYEQLVWELAETYTVYADETGKNFTCNAAYACLEELSSLLRPKKSEDVARFLLNMYDGKPYKYSTRTAGKAHIETGCLNFVAGTTPDFLEDAEENKLIGEGLLSRFLLIYAPESDRPVRFHIPKLTPEQLAHQDHLQRWLSFLGTVYGSVDHADEDTFRFLETWWTDEALRLRRFNDERLEKAFARRKVHVIKLAMALHFSEATDMRIQRSTFEAAISLAHELERHAVDLLKSTGRNKTYGLQRKLISALRAKSPQMISEIMLMLSPHLNLEGIMSIIDLATKGNEIVAEGDWVFAVEPGTRDRIVNNDEYQSPTNTLILPPSMRT